MLYDSSSVWNPNNKTNEQTKQNRNSLLGIENKLRVAREGQGWGARVRGNKRYTFPVVKSISQGYNAQSREYSQ